MGKLIDDLLSEIKDPELNVKLYKICNKIMDEKFSEFKENDSLEDSAEISQQEDIRHIFKWPNMYLVFPVENNDVTKNNDICYICLERVDVEKYATVYFSKNPKTKNFKKIKVWLISEYNDPRRILKEFIEKYIFLNGKK